MHIYGLDKLGNRNSEKDHFERNIDKSFCFNMDDFHSIHGYRVPNTITLSFAHHLAVLLICVSKTVQSSNAVNNGVYIKIILRHKRSED